MAADIYELTEQSSDLTTPKKEWLSSPSSTILAGRVPVAAIAPHVQALLDVGHTAKSVSALLPRTVGKSFVYDVAHRRVKTVASDLASALLAIPATVPDGVDVSAQERVPAESVTSHLRSLRQAGMTVQQISEASGLAMTVVSDISRGNVRTVSLSQKSALLSVSISIDSKQPVDAVPVRDHVRSLLNAGASHATISSASSVPLSTVGHLASGKLKRIQRKSADALLALAADAVLSESAVVPVEKSKRMIEELFASGYTAETLAEATGLTREAITSIARGRRTTVRFSTQQALESAPPNAPVPTRGRTSADRAQAHILYLYDMGAIDRSIGDAAGVTPSIIQKIRVGSQKVVLRHTEEWILAVTPDMARVEAHCSADEVRAHIEALRAQGVNAAQIGRAASLAGTHIRDIARGKIKKCTPETVDRILSVTVENALADDEVWADLPAVKQHLQALHDSNLTVHQIARAAGVSDMAIHLIMDGTTTRVTMPMGEAILGVLFPEPALVSAVGSRRRVQALVANGWSVKQIEQGCGRKVWELLSPKHSPRQITADKAVAIAEFYAVNENTAGGRTQARSLAAKKGWLRAGWWDSDKIDDPSFYPKGLPSEIVEARKSVVREMRLAGNSITDIADLLGLPTDIARRDFVECLSVEEISEQVTRLRGQGLTFPEVADVMGVNKRTALWYSRRATSPDAPPR